MGVFGPVGSLQHAVALSFSASSNVTMSMSPSA